MPDRVTGPGRTKINIKVLGPRLLQGLCSKNLIINPEASPEALAAFEALRGSLEARACGQS